MDDTAVLCVVSKVCGGSGQNFFTSGQLTVAVEMVV